LLSDDAVLVMPVLPERGPLVAWSHERLREFRAGCLRLTAPSSLAGLPQLVLPTTSDAGYVPLSLLARRGTDASLLLDPEALGHSWLSGSSPPAARRART
jgi:Asp-tRNA(Asn)/Glu-tRNA(Gln) amidotransferase A subunit family amidase